MLEGGQMAGHVHHPCAKAAGNLHVSNTFLTTRDEGRNAWLGVSSNSPKRRPALDTAQISPNTYVYQS